MTIEKITKELEKNKNYHFRVHKGEQYIFFGDIDHYDKSINEYIGKLKIFMKENYELKLEEEEVKYTQNEEDKRSYHYSIPKWNASTEKLKEIHKNILKKYPELKQKIDTTIYSNHWFRCPNQSKGTNKGVHKYYQDNNLIYI